MPPPNAIRVVLVGWLSIAGIFAQVTPESIIRTAVGTDWTFQGDGKPALDAPIGEVAGLAFDAAGNLYIGDPRNFQIYRVGTDGILQIVGGNGFDAGNTAVADARLVPLNRPRALAIGPDGSIYFAESYTVRRIAPDGTVRAFAGTGSVQSSGDNGLALQAGVPIPLALVADRDGNVYIAADNRVRKVTTDGIIRTIAGTGVAGYSGDGGQATAAGIHPQGLALDNDGNLYIGDGNNGRVRKVTPQGVISTIAGGGTNGGAGGFRATDAAFNFTTALDFDAAGNLYVAEGPRIRKIGLDGNISTFASVPSFSLNAIRVDGAGNVLYADPSVGTVRRISPSGAVTTFAGNGQFKVFPEGTQATQAFIKESLNLAISPDGLLYFSDVAQPPKLRRVEADGRVTTVASEYARGMTFDAAGNFYYTAGTLIRRVNTAGNVTTVTNTGDFATGLARDAAGNFYVTHRFSHRIRKVTPAGVVSNFAGTGEAGFLDGPGAAAQFREPESPRFDAAGNLYIVDTGNGRIRKIAPDGTVSTFAGAAGNNPAADGSQATSGRVDVAGIAFEASGALLLTTGSSVRRIGVNGIIESITTAGFGFGGDGGPARNAKFLNTGDLAVDAAGNVYIDDTTNFRIRIIQVAPPTFSVTPQSLSFTVKAGDVPPVAQQVLVSGSAVGMGFAIAATGTFVKFPTSSSVTPANIPLTVDAAGLNPGTYQGTVRFSPVVTGVAPVTVNVTLTVQPADAPKLTVDTQELSFSFATGGDSGGKTVRIGNSGGGSAAFTATVATKSGGSWLMVAPASGNVTATAPIQMLVTVNSAGLPAGAYTGTVTVQDPAGPVFLVPVTMVVNNVQPIRLSHTGLTFLGVVGGGTAPPQEIAVVGAGQGAYTFTAKAIVAAGLPHWLSVAPGSGSGDTSQPAPRLAVAVNPAGLAPGDYFGRIEVAATSSPAQIATIVLRLLPAGSDPGPIVQPSGLLFTGVEGGTDPGSQTITVTNLTAATVNFGSGLATLDGRNYVKYQPAFAAVAPGSFRIVVQPTLEGLAAGVYRGAITLVFSNGSIRTVAILVVIAPRGTTFDAPRSAVGCQAKQLLPLLTTLGENLSVPASYPTGLEVRVVDDCGEPLRTGTVISTFSNGDPPLRLVSLGDGSWTATWVSRNVQPREVNIATTAEDSIRGLKGSVQTTVGLSGEASPPVIGAGGVVSAASLAGQTPLAPGAMVSIFGAGLATGALAAPRLPLGDTLADATVVVGGRTAPILYSSSGQINAILPYGLPANARVQMIVIRGTQVSQPEEITIAAAQPAVYTVNGSGQGQGHGYVASASGLRLADQAAPAKAGDVLVIYGAGLGQVDQTLVEGTASPAEPPARTLNTVTMTIGGKEAVVPFAGLAPGFAGLYQINAIVPEGVAPGGQIPVIISAAGQSSPLVTIAIQ